MERSASATHCKSNWIRGDYCRKPFNQQCAAHFENIWVSVSILLLFIISSKKKKKALNVLNKVTSKQHTNNGAWLASEQDRARIGKSRAIGTCVTHVNVSQWTSFCFELSRCCGQTPKSHFTDRIVFWNNYTYVIMERNSQSVLISKLKIDWEVIHNNIGSGKGRPACFVIKLP